MTELTTATLAAIMPRASPILWLDALNAAAARFEINSRLRMSAWLSQLADESGELTTLEENLHYSAERLMQVYPREFPDMGVAMSYAGQPEKIANRVYSGLFGNGNEQSGDGYRFRGRGPIQITFQANYRACAEALADTTILEQPDRLMLAAPGAMSAAWFFKSHGCIPLADAGNVDAVSRRINGPGMAGRATREKYFYRALKALQGA